MKRTVLAFAATFLLVMAPVLAYAQRTPPPGSTTVGSAGPRGGGGESTASSSSSGGSASDRGASSSSGNSGASGGSGITSSPVGNAGARYAGPRSGESGDVPRARTGANVGQPVPASERPRGDRPPYGYAGPRGSVNPPIGNGGTPGWSGGYWPYWGYGYDSYYPGYDYWGWYPWGVFDPVFGSSAAGEATYTQDANGSLRLKVKPKEAEVYVDEAFYGYVNDYDGTFQHLDLRVGPHRLELRAEGYEPMRVDLRILPGKTVTISGELKPLK